MKIIPADLDAERYGRLAFIRDTLVAWRHYRTTGQRSRAATARGTMRFALSQERAIRVQRLKDLLQRNRRGAQ